MKWFTVFFIALGLMVNLSAGAQTCTWADAEETGYDLNPGMVNYLVAAAPDQTVWFGGLKEKLTSYYLMMGNNFLIRYDNAGNRLANYMISGTVVISAMKCDPTGHLYIAGDFIDQDIQFWDGTVLHWDGNSINSFLARINDQGTVDWSINLNVARGEYSPVADMAFANGKVYLAHNIWLNTVVSAVDGTGNLSVFLTQANVGILSSLDFDTGGNLYCTGSCAGDNSLYNGVSFPPPTFYNKYLVKYNPSGVPQWVDYSEDVTCIGPKVRVDHDNNIYWTGQLNNPCLFDTVALQGPFWVYDFYLVKMNPQGSGLWGREVPQVITGDATTGPLDIIRVMQDNSVTIGGVTRGMIDWGNGVVSDMGSVNEGAWLLNYSSQGDAQWTKTGSGGYSDLKSVDLDPAGNLFFTGVGHDTVMFDDLSIYRETYYYPYFVKVEDSPTGVPGINLTRHVSVAPNPASDIITLLPGTNITGPVDIIDMNGKVAKQFTNPDHMDVSTLPPGLYYIRFGLTGGGQAGAIFMKR
jgi:hypothetical protein